MKFNPETGWCFCSHEQLKSYYCIVESEPEPISERLIRRNIPFYIHPKDRGLRTKCTDSQLYHVLTGKHSNWFQEMPPYSELKPHYVTVSIIGTKLYPTLYPHSVNLLLCKGGFQSEEGKSNWIPTEKGLPYSKKKSYLGKHSKEIIQYMWSWDLISTLQSYLV